MTCIIRQNRHGGFFSDFNTILGSLYHFKTNNFDNYYYFWNNNNYQNSEYNMFDKYFFNQNNSIDDNKEYKTAVDVGYPYILDAQNKITNNNDRSGFKNIHETLKYFNYFENIFYKNCKQKINIKSKTLGVHVRQTDHWEHGPLLSCDYYFEKIDEKIKYYDYIFLATDENSIVYKFQNKYSDKLYLNEKIIRSDDHTPIHRGKYSEQKEKLAEDVFIDSLSLAACDEIIITSSNISQYIFCINPNINFFQIDKHIQYK